MKLNFSFWLLFFVSLWGKAQTVSTDTAVPSPSKPVTITFDVSGTAFAAKNLNDVWLWTWLEKGIDDVNAPTNINPATSAQDGAKVTRSTINPNIYFITITATTFFNKPASEIGTIGIILKGRNWSDGQTADKFLTFTETFTVAFGKPAKSLFFVKNGESINIVVDTNQASTITLKVGSNTLASSSPSVTTFTHSLTVNETQGSVTVTAEAISASESRSASFTYVLRTATVLQARPAGVIDGINYFSDATTAVLSLWAPGKSSVYILGDFNNWKIDPAFQMKKDGEHFWLDIKGLLSGKEYAFQYLVDETVKIADPYADKILDPDDQYIPATSYPNLNAYPSQALSDQWYFNRLAVLQTNQTPYPWVTTGFRKPAKQDLVIYEVLVRDFFGSGNRNFQNLIDTLGYLKRLGINAIELMPIMEFNGNESWGYNPTFMFAADKYYGTKDKFKKFIEVCHQNGIAVILDIAMNHQDIPNPYAMMDFDFINGKPETDNKWFNVNPTHPFNVFFDMNHESAYTKKYLDTVNYYWLNEYKVDGFRFDLSKGFTQTNNPVNVDAWSSYDASRIALLKRMADKIWSHTPDAYVILEHLSVNSEEKELAEYRADEGKGMLLWGKMTDPYNQLTMGYVENSDITGILHQSRGWTVPHLVGYMESHDEERLMVKNMLYGNIVGSYSAKDKLISLSRMRAANTVFYTLPGPKMLWQFGELGYDFSINLCQDGSINQGCRVSPKPVKWNYRDETQRYRLYDHIRDLLRLRNAYKIFTTGTVNISPGNSLVKQISLKNNPYTVSPSGPQEMNAVVTANFDLVSQDIQVAFPHEGTWYDYYAGGTSLTVAGSTHPITIAPGGYKMFTDVPLESTLITHTEESLKNEIGFYPNPVGEILFIKNDGPPIYEMTLFTPQGIKVNVEQIDASSWDVKELPAGLYIAVYRTSRATYSMKIIKSK